MVDFYKIINEDRKVSMPIKETVITDCIKLSKNRNKELYSRLVEIHENLKGKKLNKEDLERY